MQNKSPCFIEKGVLRKGQLYFSATDTSTLLSVRLPDCIRAGSIKEYTKYKMPEVSAVAIALAVGAGKLVALCSDSYIRVW
jgi:hypothetical protein